MRPGVIGFGQFALATAFAGLGWLGVVSSLSRTEPSTRPAQGTNGRDELVSYTNRRIVRLQVRLRRAPGDPDLRLKLAQAYAGRATAMAHEQYERDFPGALQEGRISPEEYALWCRGWLHSDRCGDLRRAAQHARSVLAAPAAPSLHRRARRFVEQIQWQRGQEVRAPVVGGCRCPHILLYPRGDALPTITVTGRGTSVFRRRAVGEGRQAPGSSPAAERRIKDDFAT
jgi:hypothetical protein